MTDDRYIVAGKIRANLADIRTHYDNALDPGHIADDSDKRGTSKAGEPINLHTVDVRQSAHTDLAYWCRFILDNVNDGTITTQTIHADDTTSLTRFVDTWALALCEQLPDDGDNLRKDTGKHARALKALALGWRTKKVQVSDHCPETVLVLIDGLETITRCKGTLHATLTEEDGTMLPGRVVCDTTPDHEWTPWQWRDLGRRIGSCIA